MLPGHVAARVDPSALRQLAARLRQGAVLVSGTNGKTTTARTIAAVCTAAGLRPVHNRAGANLPAGVLSALVGQATVGGDAGGDIGIFEIDEANVPMMVEQIPPHALVLTNLFRDQLDRYGEVNLLAQAWEAAVKRLEASAWLVVNVDDPGLAHLARQAGGRGFFYGIESRTDGLPALAHEADHQLCPGCGQRLTYAWCHYGHLGHYGCNGCGWQRPTPDLAITLGPGAPNTGREILLTTSEGELSLRVPLPGLYNVYNVAAAAATAYALSLAPAYVKAGVEGLTAAFGRQERIPIGAGWLTLVLVKNPVGFNQALRTIPTGASLLVVAINDRLADGTDVSWLWDVDAELLAEQGGLVLCTGLRAHDMALRLKYAGARRVEIAPGVAPALDCALATAAAGGDVVLFATYTAILEARREFHRRGHLAPFWED